MGARPGRFHAEAVGSYFALASASGPPHASPRISEVAVSLSPASLAAGPRRGVGPGVSGGGFPCGPLGGDEAFGATRWEGRRWRQAQLSARCPQASQRPRSRTAPPIFPCIALRLMVDVAKFAAHEGGQSAHGHVRADPDCERIEDSRHTCPSVVLQGRRTPARETLRLTCPAAVVRIGRWPVAQVNRLPPPRPAERYAGAGWGAGCLPRRILDMRG